jgi:glucose-1-phosphate cytidylyltransferase
MKAVILAGGLGTRISEETCVKPKPMVEIGTMPILWHIMKIYSSYGINDFIICCGYKSHILKQFFLKLLLHEEDPNIIDREVVEIKGKFSEPWNVTLVETGLETMTGGRLKKIQKLVDDTFCFTYGDTLNDLNIKKLIKFHKEQGRLATVTACKPPEKYGILEIKENEVVSFKEKISREDVWVNGGFFVLEPDIFDYIKNDSTVWEKEPMEKLTKNNQLNAYKHYGFYQSMDTTKEREILDKLWKEDKAQWKVWK